MKEVEVRLGRVVAGRPMPSAGSFAVGLRGDRRQACGDDHRRHQERHLLLCPQWQHGVGRRALDRLYILRPAANHHPRLLDRHLLLWP